MDSFLKETATKIFHSHNIKDLKNLNIILPSRRAVHFFKIELASSSVYPFLAPNIVSIDDFIINLSGLLPISTLELYFKVYDIFYSLDNSITFEKFQKWASVLIKDFENIDLALVKETAQLFRYMSESDAISRWNLEEEHSFTENTLNYFSFFDKIGIVYEKLRANLFQSKKCYKGMAYRYVAENINTILENIKSIHYFVGLNALSNSEEIIIQGIVQKKLGICIWDSDNYYMNSENKAGKKLRYYKNSGKFGQWNQISDLLKNSEKEINVIGLQYNSLQVQFIKHLAEQNQLKRQVVVVLDENLFPPLILNLPKFTDSFNISMGMPVVSSNFYGVITSFFENAINSSEENFQKKINSKLFLKIIENPILKGYINYNDNLYQKIVSLIKLHNKFFINKEFLIENDAFNEIFNCYFEISKNETFKVLNGIITLTNNLISFLEKSENNSELIYVNSILQKINLLQKIVTERPEVTLESLFSLLNEIVRTENIPFAANPSANIQIMSMLETRCLDFDTVTILSLNEGRLPSTTKNKSFIAFDAAKIFGLPLYSDQDAIMAYHFFRLLQRAKTLNLLYLLPSAGGVGTKEKSRFILEIEEELVLLNKGIKVKYPKINLSGNSQNSEKVFFIEKTEEIISETKKYLSENGLFPSHIEDWVACKLRFYWKRIEKIKKENEIDNKFRADVIGNIIHYTLEEIDKRFVDKKIDIEALKSINIPQVIDKIIKRDFAGYETKTGLNSVLKDIVTKMLNDFFELQIKKLKSPIKIIANEILLSVFHNFELNGEEIKVKVSGIIDRIDENDSEINLVDYKSGMVEDKNLTLGKDVTDIYYHSEKGKLRQLFIYKYLLIRNLNGNKPLNITSGKQIIPRIYSFRNLESDLILDLTTFSESEQLSIINDYLEIIASDILDVSKPIVQTQDIKNCEYCDFKNLCLRT